MKDKIIMSDEYWKKKLSSKQFHILRESGTESAFSGRYVDNKKKGIYYCAACCNKLFSSDAKFDSGTGWPSFDSPISKDSIEMKEDNRYGMNRIEIRCSKCDGHLGHVFDDGPTGKKKRYCINSCALDFSEL
jgi:peptide-methionine (R)-S-oxide reductase